MRVILKVAENSSYREQFEVESKNDELSQLSQSVLGEILRSYIHFLVQYNKKEIRGGRFRDNKVNK